MYDDDIRVFELSRRARVAQKQFGLLAAQRFIPRYFDRDCAIELGIAGHPHAAELPHAQLAH